MFQRSLSNQSLYGRIGGLTTHSRHDSKAIAARARVGFEARFEREVDPENVLPETERRRRAVLAKRAYMNQLAAKSAIARKNKRSRSESIGGDSL